MPEGDNNQSNQNNNGQGAGGNNAQQNAGKTFTQEQLDAIIEDRLGRERKKYTDYEDLKKAKSELDQLKQSQMTEAEKLQNQLKTLNEENASLKSRVLTSLAEAAAAKAGALYPDLVAAKIPADALDDAKKLEAALAEVKKAYPALFGGKAGGSVDGGAGAGKTPQGGMNDFIRRSAGR